MSGEFLGYFLRSKSNIKGCKLACKDKGGYDLQGVGCKEARKEKHEKALFNQASRGAR
jgi:hypothetical protein